ncbi:MFS transporter [Desulfotomaculum nigrificans]|uniref:MFS transporter n=1 Tax=Desulfotomaculum nigrificans TaxID=1565 RepID=UPI001F491AFB|nr:MFS transporter [Desulfotomaculum nigrificans]
MDHIKDVFLKLVIALYYAAQGVFLPYLPVLFKNQGFPYWQIGILLAIGPIINILTQSAWGYFCDKLQTVKKLLLLQLAISTVLSIFILHFHSFWGLLAYLTVFYFFYRPLPSLIDTLTVNAVKDRPTRYGNYRMFGSLGFTLAALGSGYLLNRLGVQNSPYLISVLLGLNLLCALQVHDAKYICSPPRLRDLTGLVKKPEVLQFLLAATLLGTTQAANDNFISVHLQNLGGSIKDTGLAWTVGVTAEIIAFFVISRLHFRRRMLSILGFTSLLYGTRWLLMAYVTSIKLILVIQLLHGTCYALFLTAVQNHLLKTIPDQLRATGQGLLYMTVFGLGGVLGITGGGVLMGRFGAQGFYLTCLFFTLGAFMVFNRLKKKVASPSRTQQ